MNEQDLENDTFIENLVPDEVKVAASKFKKWLPNLHHLITPILNKAY